MTREEYLNQLKNNIQSLTLDEQAEALQYYSDYFEEADDDEKVMEELGSPEELAKTVKENFSNALVKSKSDSKSEEKSEESDNNTYNSQEAMYFEYAASKVKNLSISLKAADTVIIPGDRFAVETRGIDREALNCSLSSEGNLNITNSGRINFSFFNHYGKRRIVPKILITIPEGAELNRFNLNLGAGNCRTKDVNFKCKTGFIDVGAGNLSIKSVYGGKIDFRCAMGNINFDGVLTGVSNIDCGMGNISLNIKGNPDDYSNDAKVGLGHVRINNDKKSGVCQDLNENRKQNHISVNCGMGSVSIKIKQ